MERTSPTPSESEPMRNVLGPEDLSARNLQELRTEIDLLRAKIQELEKDLERLPSEATSTEEDLRLRESVMSDIATVEQQKSDKERLLNSLQN